MKKSRTIFRKKEVMELKAFGKYENLSRGTMEFPAEYYNLYNGHVNYVMKYHWHMDWEIVKVNSGTLHITLNENSFDLKPDEAVIIPGGILHGAEPSDCTYECVVFDSSVIFGPGRHIKSIIRSNVKHAVMVRKAEGYLFEFAEKFIEAVKQKFKGYEVFASGALNLLLGEIIKTNPNGVTGTETEIGNKRIDNIKEALNEALEFGSAYHRKDGSEIFITEIGIADHTAGLWREASKDTLGDGYWPGE